MAKDRFFTRLDWAAFWAATLIVFVVYFWTLGPSVGLEDSGELATAGAHLGVPHPPGYPFWTLCSWIFCKLFSWVGYMGHPTPAWAISCFSATAGAFAAGCTAMLITRSSRDFIAPEASQGALDSDFDSLTSSKVATKKTKWLKWFGCSDIEILSFAGGVAGALTFALSPVEWSQSTIVEIYSLNALFLMLVFLLSYRWLRKPSDKILWFTAFVFGLGLTNYQVLVFAIVPLAIIIAVKNLPMFRDVFIYLIPVALTCQLLQIGQLAAESPAMQNDVIAKHVPVGISEKLFTDDFIIRNHGGIDLFEMLDKKSPDLPVWMRKAWPQVNFKVSKEITDSLKTKGAYSLTAKTSRAPSSTMIIIGVLLVVTGIFAGLIFKKRKDERYALKALAGVGGAGVLAMVLSTIAPFASEASWTGAYLEIAPLVEPWIYVLVGALAAASALAAVAAAIMDGEKLVDFKAFTWNTKTKILAASVAFALAAIVVALSVPQAESPTIVDPIIKLQAISQNVSVDEVYKFLAEDYMVKGYPNPPVPHYAGPQFPWAWSSCVFWGLIVILFALSLTTKKALAFAIPVAGLQIAAFILLKHGAMNGLTHPASWWFGWPIAWNFVLLALAWATLPNGRSVAGAAFFAQLGAAFYAYMPIVSEIRNPPMNWGYPRTWDGFKHAIMRGQYEAIGIPSFKGTEILMDDWCAAVAKYQDNVFVSWFIFKAAAFKEFFTFLAKQIAHYFIDLKVQFTDLMLFFAPIPFAAGHWIVGKAKRKTFWQWMAAAVACFLMMSILLMLLAQVKGDIQDGFIQKVKFISSHAMIALWIGYGLVFATALAGFFATARTTRREIFNRWAVRLGAGLGALAIFTLLVVLIWNSAAYSGIVNFIEFILAEALILFVLTAAMILADITKIGRKAVIWTISAAMILVALIAPIAQNYCGENYANGVNELVFKMGGSEQNDHTFGWQFGAYQLEGAKAINEQLDPDEEPLPDPDWPPPMEPYSIFFGGTDPGRFVPTYMIYSALYRPDVYLITQNALADDTYMAVQRDLYGDEIWIPAREDSAVAFRKYQESHKEGEDFVSENGKMQVTGALSVMELNYTLTEMMFEHEKKRHSFYVEESYPIPWMYPYLSPHGLIMKINRDKTPYDKRTAARDRDFWDWYSRRLMNDPMYRRDFAAQKSFSKLRTAISGLYIKQGMREDAAQAFREAMLLYPASPEAIINYTQYVLFPRRDRWQVIEEILDYTDKLDPNNTRTERLRKIVEEQHTIERLDAKYRAGEISRDERVVFARNLIEAGLAKEAAAFLATNFVDKKTGRKTNVTETSNDGAELLEIGNAFLGAGDLARAEIAFKKGKALSPVHKPDHYLALAKTYFQMAVTKKDSSFLDRAESEIAAAKKRNRFYTNVKIESDDILKKGILAIDMEKASRRRKMKRAAAAGR
ncbi:MAG: DUF2723 domain-containing protein [Kiritimatiellae bacterium]|nr:DUF2723 domain-containing protein [Kiritimatiellia bacterium]